MEEEIMTLAQAISGPGEARQELLAQLCLAAEETWQRRLRPGLTAADCGRAFLCAAAFTAAADLAAAEPEGGVTSFTAGEVSVRGRTAGEAAVLARQLRQTAERLMAPYALPADFCFREVRG